LLSPEQGASYVLHAILITDDREAAELLGSLIRSSGQIHLDRVFCPSPSHYQLTVALNSLTSDIALIDVSNPDQTRELYEQIRAKAPKLAVAGFSIAATPHERSKGVVPFTLELPLTIPALLRTVRDAIHAKNPKPLKNVFAILPAKAGGGASTIAVNTAAYIARLFQKSVLVAECDLRSGTIADRLNLKPQQSTGQTLGCADVASSLIWPRHICRKEGIDLLLTTRDRNECRPEWHSYYHLLSFVSPRYDCVLLDLPELINDATAEVAQSAAAVFIVTTQEFLSLRLALERVREVEAAGVKRSRIRILVNRFQSGDVPSDQIAQILGCEVECVFPEDYRIVNDAILANSFVDPHTRLGSAYRSFAGFIAGEQGRPAREEKKRSFFEAFRPARAAVASHLW
jgi:cellulose biosynthesis protein BcsQ